MDDGPYTDTTTPRSSVEPSTPPDLLPSVLNSCRLVFTPGTTNRSVVWSRLEGWRPEENTPSLYLKVEFDDKRGGVIHFDFV